MDSAGIYARFSPLLDCAVEVGVVSGRVIGVSFPAEVPEDAADAHPLLARVFAYLDGTDQDLTDAPVGLTVPTDQRRVLEAVRKIPSGQTATVERVARLAGFDPDEAADLALVESALAANPVPLFVPDHRVDAEGATPAQVADRLRRLEA